MKQQRKNRKKEKLPDARIKILSKIGFQWEDCKKYLSQLQWDEQFKLLYKYKEKHGHSNVPKSYEIDTRKLGRWMGRQRCLYKKLLNGTERV